MAEELIGLKQVREAQKRIEGVAVRSGLDRLDRQRLADAGCVLEADAPDIWIKDESEQPVGSFKLRGAYNKIASLDEESLRRGVIAYSSGNHACGVAYAAQKKNIRAVVVMPETSPKGKQEAAKNLGAEVVLVGPASSERQQKAEELQREFGYTMVPPYDDDLVIAGAATCGIEVLEQQPKTGLILVPVSGGGLLGGVAAAIKLTSPDVKIYGVEPELAGDAKQSFETKSLAKWSAKDTTRTIADGLRAQGLGQRNFAHILQYADGIITVTEEEILQATRLVLLATNLVAEPSGAVALAGALFHWKDLPRVEHIAVILSGGNLDSDLKSRLLAAKE